MASTICELQWISYILQKLQIKGPLRILLWCGNQAAHHKAANPVFYEHTEHFNIDYP